MTTTPTVAGRLVAFMADEIFPRHLEMQAFIENNKPGTRPKFLATLQEKARQQGLWNLGLPELPDNAPGTRLTNTEFAPIAETLGQIHWAAEVFNCQAPDLPNMEMLVKVGTAAQKERWLYPMLDGKIKSGFAMTEPNVASSDALNIACKITEDGDDFVLNGHKWFAGNVGLDCWQFIIVIGKSDPQAEPHARHSAIIVPVASNGLEVVRHVPVLGFQHRAKPHGEIRLNNVRVPRENLLGERGRGFAAAQVRLATARIHHCMRSIGGAELMISLMVERARARKAFGKKLSEHDKIREFIALSRVEVDQARLLTLAAAEALDAKGSKGARREISMIKLAVASACYNVADRAVQVFGAMGLTNDSPVADYFAQMRALRIYDGPDEVHVHSIARHEFKRQQEREGAPLLRLLCRNLSLQ